MATKSGHKSRKTPSSEHPASPPLLPGSIDVLYHALNQSLLDEQIASYHDRVVTSQILYKPFILAQARCTFEGSRWSIYHEREVVRVVAFPPFSGMADWDNNLMSKWENMNTRQAPEGLSFYVFDKTFDFSEERFDVLKEEFIHHLMSAETLELYYNPFLKVYRKLHEKEENFVLRCLEQARESLGNEMGILNETKLRQETRLKERLEREVRDTPAMEVPDSTLETNRSEMEAQGSMVTIDQIGKEMVELEAQKVEQLKEFEERVQEVARSQEKDIFRLNRANIQVLRFSLVWLPYTEIVIQDGEGRRMEQIKSF